MTEKIIVMVSDLDDGVHGEINVMESPDQAARFVESLIESGFDQQRIRVFLGGEMEMEVHHRPVVNLLNTRSSQEEPAPQAEDQKEDAGSQEEEAKEEVAVSANARSRALRMEEVAASAEPFQKNGVRFSSQFRPA